MPSARRPLRPGTEETRRSTTKRPARFRARLTLEQKRLFERAAALTGRSFTEFVIDAAQDAANRTIQDFEIMTLSERDSRALIKAFLNSPPPGPRLREAARWYKEQYCEQPIARLFDKPEP